MLVIYYTNAIVRAEKPSYPVVVVSASIQRKVQKRWEQERVYAADCECADSYAALRPLW